MKLSLALLAGAASAYSSCSNDWYFQEGKSYTYDLTSKLDGHLEFFDGGVPASKGTNKLSRGYLKAIYKNFSFDWSSFCEYPWRL